jgi:acyl dehydratase
MADATTPPEPYVDRPLTVTDFVRYQGASGDMNPIHHDHAFAVAAGYPGPFAVGMRQAGVLGAYATDWLGAANLRRFSITFREQAWPGDVLEYSAEVVELRHQGGEDLVDITLECRRRGGGAHIVGQATFRLPPI